MMTDIDKYLSFVLTMFIAFGITFETPVVVIVLVRMGVVTLDKLRSVRAVRHRRRVRRRRDLHPARRRVAAAARGPAVAALRDRHAARPVRRAAAAEDDATPERDPGENPG